MSNFIVTLIVTALIISVLNGASLLTGVPLLNLMVGFLIFGFLVDR